MSSDPWHIYKDEPSGSIDYNRLSNMFQNNRPGYSTSFTTTTTTTNYFPVLLVVGLVVGGGVLFCIIVLCCICFRRKSPGRVLVAPPETGSHAPAQYFQEQTNPGYNMAPAGGTALYPMVSATSPNTYSPDPTAAQYKTDTGASGYPRA